MVSPTGTFIHSTFCIFTGGIIIKEKPQLPQVILVPVPSSSRFSGSMKFHTYLPALRSTIFRLKDPPYLHAVDVRSAAPINGLHLLTHIVPSICNVAHADSLHYIPETPAMLRHELSPYCKLIVFAWSVPQHGTSH